jgi:hypothetical protein
MRKLIPVFIALFVSAATLSFADQSEQLVTLKDGSQIKGHISGIANGVYTITTASGSTVQESASSVASIVNTGAQVATSTQN